MATIGSLVRELPGRFRRVTRSTGYMSQIDGLRFLAIIVVVFYHISLRGARLRDAVHPLTDEELFWKGLFPHGDVGVTLFFFVSGYIIAFPFMRSLWQGGAWPRTADFYRRRVLRLGPPYLLVLVLSYLMLVLSGFAPKDAPKFNAVETPLHQSLIASLFYMHNLWFGAGSRLNPPLWTLEVEVQFYLLAPFLIAAYCRVRNLAARRAIAVGAIVAALIAAQIPFFHQALADRMRWSVLAYFHFFLLGILVADLVFGRGDREWRRTWLGDAALLGGVLVLFGSGVPKVYLRPLLETVVAAVQLLAILAIFYGAMAGRVGSRILGAPWIALIGGMCYSIYLVHVPLIQLCAEVVRRLYLPDTLGGIFALMFAVALPVVLVAALLFYIFVEYPAMRPDWPQQLRAAIGGWLRGLPLRRPEPR